MRVINKEAYLKWKKSGINTEWSTKCSSFAEKWANSMEALISIGKSIPNIAENTLSSVSDNVEHTIAQNTLKMMVTILYLYWEHGADLADWYNKRYGDIVIARTRTEETEIFYSLEKEIDDIKPIIGHDKYESILNNIKKIKDAMGITYHRSSDDLMEYNDAGLLLHSKIRGVDRWYEYDSNNNMVHYRSSNGDEDWREYDNYNNVIHYTDNTGYEFWKEYDNTGMKLCHFRNSDGYEF